MSSASDINAYAHSVEPAQTETLFNSKKWTYIQDSTSNTGQYSGQIQFNLSTISSQASFVNWSEAVIELPVKLMITNGGASSITTTGAASYDQLIPKAGSWHFIDSVQVVVDGVTVQTNQVMENVNCSFKTLTEWSQDDLLNYGATTGFALDKFEPPVPAQDSSLENLALSKFQNTKAYDFGLSNSFINPGARERAKMTSVDPTSTKLANSVLGTAANTQSIGRAQVWTAAAGSIAVGAPIYVAHYIATIRLADISDYFKKAPMQKNVSGFIYLNYNSSQTTLVQNTAGVIDPGVLDSIACNMQFGNTCPVLYNFSSVNVSGNTTGTATGLAVPASSTLSITADINGTSTAGTGITPPQTFSRLLVPTFMPNPSADHSLTQKKSFRYFERITNKFTVLPNASFTWTVTNGIANPKKLIMMPIISSMTAGGTVADVINPFRSPLSTIPATCSPFASLKNLQVTVGNLPCFNNPVSFGYDLFVQEMSESGMNGGLDDETNHGLLSQQLWESLYRFVAVDIGRRLPSEDGAAKSIVVSGTNNTNFPLTIYYHVLRDAVATVDTSMGTVQQGRIQQS
ncbi:hypothetical protein BBJ28_00026241 [Nothophytophthora sp. Chile5]|nr:hypothetical protein BBJ28_00026241 [Nothophytophthora sp. Chile5]